MHRTAIIPLVVALVGNLGWVPSVAASSPGNPDLPPTRAEIEPKRFRLRTGSLELGVAWRPELSSAGVCGYNILCGFTPRLGFDFELGSRAARLLAGSHIVPIPTFTGDLVSLEVFMVEVGALFGGPRVRGGIVVNGGAINAGGGAMLRLSPWVDRRGHRHGLDLRVTTSIFVPLTVAISYRFYPRKLDRKYPAR